MAPADASLLKDLLAALWRRDGRAERTGDDDVLGVLVRMMLAQATSKANAAAAFGNLLDAFGGDWGKIRAAPVEDVARAIAVGGLAHQKAPRIQRLLRDVAARFGDHTLEALRDWNAADALQFLLERDGIGPTTASFALMDAAGFDVLPVNGGIHRVLWRLGAIEPSADFATAAAAASFALEPGECYPAHMALVAHARQTCTKRSPRCALCPVAARCPSAVADEDG